MENQPHIRFAETPPGSPKSCLKGARKLTFEEKGVGDPSGDVLPMSTATTTPPRSPRKSSKVCIRSPGDNSSPSMPIPPPVIVEVPPPLPVKPPDIQFSQHYEQATPPPNCTSNGAYDFVEPTDETGTNDPRKDPQLMEVASHFVNDIIEQATLEATNRQKPETSTKPNLTTIARDILSTGRRSVYVQRVQGTVSKWFTNLCTKAQNSIRT